MSFVCVKGKKEITKFHIDIIIYYREIHSWLHECYTTEIDDHLSLWTTLDYYNYNNAWSKIYRYIISKQITNSPHTCVLNNIIIICATDNGKKIYTYKYIIYEHAAASGIDGKFGPSGLNSTRYIDRRL